MLFAFKNYGMKKYMLEAYMSIVPAFIRIFLITLFCHH